MSYSNSLTCRATSLDDIVSQESTKGYGRGGGEQYTGGFMAWRKQYAEKEVMAY